MTVEVSGKDLGLVAKDGVYAGNLAVALGVVDGDGKLRASSAPTLALQFRPDTYNQVVKTGNFRVVAQFALPPGRYHLRAAALAAAGKNSGAVQYDLESSRAALWPSATDKHLDERLPEPTTLREFSANDELASYVEVYDNQSTPVHQTDVITTVRASDGHVVFRDEQIQRALSVSTRIPLTLLTPGLYVLDIEARARLSSVDPVSQFVQFRIR